MRIEHILSLRADARRPIRVLVVGAGGTGSAITMGLPYLDQALRVWGRFAGLDVLLMDADTVSETNCIRQPFSISDIGLSKATVLVNRINLFWGTNWRAEPRNFDERTFERIQDHLDRFPHRLRGQPRGAQHNRAVAGQIKQPYRLLARSWQQCRQRPVRAWPAVELRATGVRRKGCAR